MTIVTGVAIPVSNLQGALDFYQRILDFELETEPELLAEGRCQQLELPGARIMSAALRLGHERIELQQFLSPVGRTIPPDSRSNDRWFQHIAIIVSSMSAAISRLQANGVVPASHGPQRLPDWNPAAGGIEAFYFFDPDYHPLEVLAFPSGKGEARWQNKQALFLGIDHTAIVVDNIARSTAFYRDTLAMQIAGRSENHGPEQAALNNVPSANLEILALRANSGPAVELLHYRAPRNGWPMPDDTRACDLWAWRTCFAGAAASAGRSALLRDPDGHILEVLSDTGMT